MRVCTVKEMTGQRLLFRNKTAAGEYFFFQKGFALFYNGLLKIYRNLNCSLHFI